MISIYCAFYIGKVYIEAVTASQTMRFKKTCYNMCMDVKEKK